MTAVCAEEAALAHAYGSPALIGRGEVRWAGGGRSRDERVGQTHRGQGRDDALHCTL